MRPSHNVWSTISLAMMLEESREKIALPLRCLPSALDVSEEESQPIRLLHPSLRDFVLDSKSRSVNRKGCLFLTQAIAANAPWKLSDLCGKV
jgi:hypothetical protein